MKNNASPPSRSASPGTASIHPAPSGASRRGFDAGRLEIARAAVSDVGRTLQGSAAIVLLADHLGVILDHSGDANTLAHAVSNGLTTGFDWSEAAAGANGVGTALALGAPIRVHGDQHSCPDGRLWTCGGTIVSDPDAGVLGAICLASRDHGFAPFSIALAVSVASQIQLALNQYTNDRHAGDRLSPSTHAANGAARRRTRAPERGSGPAPSDGSSPVSPPVSRTAPAGDALTLVCAFIAAHLDAPLSLQHLADLAGMSRFHFHRCFKASFGETPRAYVLRLRLERARWLLASSPLPLTDIAGQVGFADQSHFTQIFRSATGTTPLAYRRASGDGP